jgi:2'-hydroxyisoflavone reductase
LDLLVIGGTQFVGRAFVESALAAGHRVTLFNRGTTNPDLFPETEKLRGDRDGDLGVLANRRWDAVVDCCGYVPRVVRSSAEFLAEAVALYVFISSISVYADFSKPGLHEDSPLGTLDDETVEEVNGDSYGPLKAMCERVVQDIYGERALVLRPGIVAGPNDPTDRFTYWPLRIQRGGDVVVPEPLDRQVQFIDARDLGNWTVRLIESGKSGAFNATGPTHPLSMGAFLEECRLLSGSDARIHALPGDFLIEAGAQPWAEIPLWIGVDQMAGVLEVDTSRAEAAGFASRPLVETIRDTLDWAATRPSDYRLKAGLAPEKEERILEEWNERHK